MGRGWNAKFQLSTCCIFIITIETFCWHGASFTVQPHLGNQKYDPPPSPPSASMPALQGSCRDARWMQSLLYIQNNKRVVCRESAHCLDGPEETDWLLKILQPWMLGTESKHLSCSHILPVHVYSRMLWVHGYWETNPICTEFIWTRHP